MLKEDNHIIMTLIQIWDEYTSDILVNSLIIEGTRKDSKTNQNKGESLLNRSKTGFFNMGDGSQLNL